MLVSISVLLAFLAPIPFFFLEILVGIVQALIFSILLVVYFTVAATDHDHEKHEKNISKIEGEEIEEIEDIVHA